MKKMIALVLSLVLALSLATVAFAAVPTWTDGTLINYDIYDATSNRKVNSTDTNFQFEFKAAKAPTYGTDGLCKTAGNIAYYVVKAAVDTAENTTGGVKDEALNYAVNTVFVMSETYNADAAFAVKAANSSVKIGDQTTKDALYFMIPVSTVSYDYTAKLFTAFGTKCGAFEKPTGWTDAQKYYAYTSDAGYVKLGTTPAAAALLADNVVDTPTLNNALVDGKIVTLSTAAEKITHTWGKATYDADGDLQTMTCTNCGIVGTAVESAYLAPAGTTVEAINGGTYYLYYTAAADTDTDADVESPKTFDAGIAMYVGMGLMAVAGSAVLIGKKKEF